MSVLLDKLNQIKEQDPEGFALLQELAKNARNPALEPRIRINCAMALGNALGPVMLDSIREELIPEYAQDPSGTMKRTIEQLTPPKEEYRYVRGARVKVKS